MLRHAWLCGALCWLATDAAAKPPLPTAVDGSVIAPVAALPKDSGLPQGWWHGAFMEVYVRGYQDSDGDGIGDIKGLISRLDDLKALGISGLWLMPITASQDNDHGYAVSDYRNIEPDYGTLEDFDDLLHEAHARGIGVIMDYLINHSAADHPLFESSRSSPQSPYRDWYVWKDPAPQGWNIYGKDPWHGDEFGAYFAGFWDQMPDWNLRNPKVIAFHHDNLRFWLNRGVDGFRFDAVGNLIEDGPLAWESNSANHSIMHGVAQLVASYGNRFMICEAPADSVAFASSDSCGHAFAFGHNNRVVGAGLGNPAAVERVSTYFVEHPNGLSGFASNHDAFAGQRLWDRVRGKDARYRLTAATYLLQNADPPFIYYGEEVGMSGGLGLGGDHKLRTPMSWTADPKTAGFTTGEPFRALSANVRSHNWAASRAQPDSLWHWYRDLIALRKAHPALWEGDYSHAQVDGWKMAFRRRHGEETVWVVFNYHNDSASWSPKGAEPRARWVPLWPAGATTQEADDQGQVHLSLPGTSVVVYKELR